MPDINVPTLVAVGGEDVWSLPEQRRELANAIPKASLYVIAGAGHLLPAEQPAPLNDAIALWPAAPA